VAARAWTEGPGERGGKRERFPSADIKDGKEASGVIREGVLEKWSPNRKPSMAWGKGGGDQRIEVKRKRPSKGKNRAHRNSHGRQTGLETLL